MNTTWDVLRRNMGNGEPDLTDAVRRDMHERIGAGFDGLGFGTSNRMVRMNTSPRYQRLEGNS